MENRFRHNLMGGLVLSILMGAMTPASLAERQFTSAGARTNEPVRLQFLIKLTPTRGILGAPQTEEDRRVVSQHNQYLKTLADQKLLLLAGSTLDPTRSYELILIETPSAAEAQQIMQGDPSVKANFHKPELIPFKVEIPTKK